MKVGITGAAGGLGRRATDALGQNHELVLIDNVDPAQATVYDGIPPTLRSLQPFEPTWPYQRADIMSLDDIVAALDGVEVVLHLAGWPAGSWTDAASIMQTNVMGTFTVYEAARRRGVRRVLNASSINAFGSIYWRVQDSAPIRSRLPLIEDDRRVPEDPYSLSKAITEDIGWAYRRAFGIEAVNLRFAGVWRESHYEQALQNGLPRSTSWADDLWGWVHVRDWMQCIAAAAVVADPTSEPITVGAPDTKAPEQTLDLIRRFRPEFQHELREPLPGRAPLLSISRARAFLGYNPVYTLADAPVRDSE
jgi:UDP-glucose 4-epimerase